MLKAWWRAGTIYFVRREPHFDADHAIEAVSDLARPPLSGWNRRRAGWITVIVVVTVLWHGTLLVLAVMYGARGGSGGGGIPPGAIPVQLVTLPPEDMPKPPPPPPPPPPQKKNPPPPPGRLASDDFGNPKATGETPVPRDDPAAGEVQPKAGEAPPPESASRESPKPSDTARDKPTEQADPSALPKEDELPPTPDQMAAAGSLAPPPPSQEAPDDRQSAKKTNKPSPIRLMPPQPGGAHKPTPRPDDLDQGEGHKAKYPGPDASRDEYLAYAMQLTNEHLAVLPTRLFEGRDGAIDFQVMVRPSGAVVWFSRTRSSGYPDADRAVQMALDSIAQFPPLPSEIRNPDDTPVVLSLRLSLALLARNH